MTPSKAIDPSPPSSSLLVASTQRDNQPGDLLDSINGPALQRRPVHDKLLEAAVPRRAELRVDADGVAGLGGRLDFALEARGQRATRCVRREIVERVLAYGAWLGGLIGGRH